MLEHAPHACIHALIADFVRDVQAEPSACFDLRGVVVRGVASDPRVLVELFERCGDKDLRFVVPRLEPRAHAHPLMAC